MQSLEHMALRALEGLSYALANLRIPHAAEAFSVLAIVSVWNLAFESELVKEQFPFMLHAQLRFHQLLSNLNPRRPRVNWVVLVEVDDNTFWFPPLSGTQPTNRRFLADLALKAAGAGAAVVTLDFQLKSPFLRPGDDGIREEDNRYLLEAINKISKMGIPVVLTCGLFEASSGEWKEEPNIFDRHELPTDTNVGYINLPLDKRQIPLRMTGSNWEGNETVSFDSFSFQIVKSYEQATHILRQTSESRAIAVAITNRQFVYGGFIPDGEFPKISAHKLFENDEEAKGLCRHRIVMIGGTWHQFAPGHGPLIEGFPSPIGRIPGLYLHANYVEALLDDRFESGVPLWFSIGFDVIVGFLLYVAYYNPLVSGASHIGILAAFLLPLLAAYVSFANIGRYLDFILPLGLCFVHLGFEYFKSTWR
jgi:CHASE2 domain-containing sensor protein